MADDDAVKRRWQLALNASIKPISAYWRDEARKYHDRDAVWDAFEEMIRNAQQIDSSSAIDCVRPILDSLKRFDESFLALTKGLLDTTLIWGFLYAAIKLANDTEALLYPFTRNLSNLTQDILLLSEHGRKSTAPEQLQPVMIDTYLEFSEFLSAAVEKLSPDPTFQTDEASRKKDLSTACGASKAKIDEFHDRLEKLSALARRKTFDKSTVQQTNPPDSQLDPLFAKLPCRLLPSGTNSRFFDRTEIFALIDKEFLEPIDKTLRPKADAGKICSFSLHGLGGVGKSEIALQYANSRSKYYEAVLWIRCESRLTIQQSVNDIVESLELRDMQPGNSAVNKVALKTWLQQTEAKWLLVYDNAEKEELLTEYWPGGNSGAVLITTRDRTVAVKTSQDITIEEFDELHGSQLLFTLLSKPVDSDDSSAKELAGLLDGLPLAIENIAGLIHSRGISIAEFVKMYQKNRRKVHQISGKTGRSIDTCWRLSFENLNPEGGSEPLPVSILLGILSFLNADSIPMDLFNSSRASVSNLAFLKNDWE